MESSSDSPRVTFGAKLQFARVTRGLSQTALAAALDMMRSRTLISELELGRHDPTVPVICKVAVFFQIDIDYWLFDTININESEQFSGFLVELKDLEGLQLPAKLQKLREGKQLSERELAQELSVNRSHIYNLESGRRKISPELLRRISSYFQVRASALLNDTIAETHFN